MSVRIIAPTIVRFSPKLQLAAGHVMFNNIDISVESGVSSTREDAVLDMAEHFCGIWQDALAPAWTTAVTFLGANFVDLHSADGITGSLGPSAGHPTSGTNASANATPQVAVLIHLLSTARRGQRQGRLYHAPTTESDVDAAGQVTGSRMTYYKETYDDLRNHIDDYTSSPVTSAAWRTVHVHKPEATKGDPSTWTWSSSTIDDITVDAQCATQRRRNRG